LQLLKHQEEKNHQGKSMASIINCEGVTNRIRVPTQGACMLALQKQNPALENNLSTELVAAAGTRFLAAATSYTTLKS
jgi:hypothetical protein